MADKFSKEQRSKIMSAIRGKNTSIEVSFRKALLALGFRYRKHAKLFGRPDISNRKRKIAIFIDSCFWHGCPKHYKEPKSNGAYWIPKIKRNIERDKVVTAHYTKIGWKVGRVWEHTLKTDGNKIVKKIARQVFEK